MLAQSNRLAKDKDFEKVFKLGKSAYAKALGVKARANQLKRNRYGIIVSAKVSKKAIERNKLKRRLSGILKKFDQEAYKGLDVAVIVLPPALTQSYQGLSDELKQIFIRLKLFKPDK
ncbi:MAG: ribonuclease P protein component [bacterium]|nr:ribonuclease P protein component [bacterium]